MLQAVRDHLALVILTPLLWASDIQNITNCTEHLKTLKWIFLTDNDHNRYQLHYYYWDMEVIIFESLIW